MRRSSVLVVAAARSKDPQFCELIVNREVRPRTIKMAAEVINAAHELHLREAMVVMKSYEREALDFKTRHLSDHTVASLVGVLHRRLGHDYDIVWEHAGKPAEHLHILHIEVLRPDP